jgi:DNA-binding transcriptional MerR regulator
MAAVDEATKLNGMMLMTQADPPWVSTAWVRGQLDDLGMPVSQIEDQIRAERADRALDSYIMSHAAEPSSPEHIRALRLMLEDLPAGDRKNRAQEFLASMEEAQEEQRRAQEMQQQGGMQQAPPSEQEVLAALGGGGATPTTLSRITAAGGVQGGTQVIAGGR